MLPLLSALSTPPVAPDPSLGLFAAMAVPAAVAAAASVAALRASVLMRRSACSIFDCINPFRDPLASCSCTYGDGNYGGRVDRTEEGLPMLRAEAPLVLRSSVSPPHRPLVVSAGCISGLGGEPKRAPVDTAVDPWSPSL